MSASDWPVEHVTELALLGLICCEKDPVNRPNLADDVLTKLEIMRNLFTVLTDESENQQRIRSYFVCPIFQEVMKDPYIAADGFTYEEDAIKGWLNSGHKTSPMTNLKLDHCDLIQVGLSDPMVPSGRAVAQRLTELVTLTHNIPKILF